MKTVSMFSVTMMALTLAAPAQQVAAPVQAAPQTFGISGKVVNALGGQPLAHAEVTIGPAERREAPQTVATGQDGSFQFAGLAPGKYWMLGRALGFLSQNLNQHDDFSTAVAVGPDLQSDGLIFRLRPDASITGTITDEQNEPVRAAQVMLFRSRLENGRRTTSMQTQSSSDDQGRYRFGHLPPGSYFVAVSARPWYAQRPMRVSRPVVVADGQGIVTLGTGAAEPREEGTPSPLDVTYSITFWPNSTDASQASPLVLSAGDRAVADVVLTAVPALHVRIKGVNADPAQGLNATLTEHLFDGGIVQLTSESSRIGDEVEITGAPPGRAELNLQSFGKNPTGWTQAVDLAGDTEINAGASSPAAEISGVVEMDGAPAPEGTFIQLRERTSGAVAGGQVGTKGEFQIENSDMKPGAYEVFANAQGAIVSAVSAAGAKVVGRDIEIGGGTVHLAVMLSKNLGRVDGVALRDGKPEAGAMIVLVPAEMEKNASLVRRDQSDSDGTFTLRTILPGKYTVLALANGWDLEWMNPAVLKPYLKGGEAVEVAASGKLQVRVKVQ